MFSTSKPNVYYLDCINYFYIQISFVANSSLCSQSISPHFVALDRHNFQYYISSLTDNNIFNFYHFALKIGVARNSTKAKGQFFIFPINPEKAVLSAVQCQVVMHCQAMVAEYSILGHSHRARRTPIVLCDYGSPSEYTGSTPYSVTVCHATHARIATITV